jgi:hypothetical protein
MRVEFSESPTHITGALTFQATALLLLNWNVQIGDHVQRTVRPRTDAFKYKQRIFFLSVIGPWTYPDGNRV